MHGAIPLLHHTSSWSGTWLSTGTSLLYLLSQQMYPKYQQHKITLREISNIHGDVDSIRGLGCDAVW
jgi:hypothetical protein